MALVGLMGMGAPAQAAERRDDRRDYRREDRREYDNRDIEYRQLRAEIYQLNILFSRVDSRLRFGHGRQLRWEYSRLLRDRDRLNFELQRRPLDRLRLHGQIDRLRDQLRELDVRLRVHSRYYQW